MNYRHHFHAGNFADCMKHALLIELISAFHRKPAPYVVLDTHAGIGRYDLNADPAERTGEWRAGIGTLMQIDPRGVAPLRAYLDMVEAMGFPGAYPGSPAIAAHLGRPGDQLICCELHPEDAHSLRRALGRTPDTHIHERDGYEAITGLMPHKTIKRGLILIDPPFERPDEFSRLAQAIVTARARFPSGIVAAWYPIKHRTPVRAFHDMLADAGVADVIAAELTLRQPVDPSRLNGAGLVIVRPPFGFEERAAPMLSCLAATLGEDDASGEVRRITQEQL